MSLCSSSYSSAWLRPRNSFFFLLHISLATLSFYVRTSEAISVPVRLPASPGYQGRSAACPTRCAASGPNPANWSLYHNFEQLSSCQESLFYSFSLLDPVDDPDTFHHIYTCTSFGPDWGNLNLPANTSSQSAATAEVEAEAVNGTYQIGYWPSAPGSSVSSSVATLTNQFRQYLSLSDGLGSGSVNPPTVLFASYASISVGLYIGQGLQNQGIGNIALAYLENSIATSNISSPQLAMQFCQPGQTSDHIFGLIATGNGTFAAVQDALTSWSKADCLTFPRVQNVTGTVPLVTPLVTSTNITNSTTNSNSTSTSTFGNATSIRGRAIAPRTTCSTIKVVSGDSCGSLAQKCGITGAQFTQYNPASNKCSTLQPGEHVCCSAGTLPNFQPQPQPDGTCATYIIQPGDYCSMIAATYSITVAQINSFNTQTWAWNGCNLLYPNNKICLSTGRPPMPASISNAICGPQVPGTATPPSGTDLSSLNPCPLNACCDIWGQCGTTTEFCTNSSTGAPGTAATGTNGCISNCGTNIVLSGPPATYRSIGYFEGYNLDRPCLYQDISQLDVSAYTHIYFGFGVLSSSYAVQIPGATTTYEFNIFRGIQGPRRILSIGGWDFSTHPSTYMIFREGVTAANRLTMATNIANFINENGLDGVNIDWEYPGAPDIPGIPPASTDDGANYLDFLAILRNLLPDKEITIAAPASYWYLKGFPIKAMAPLLDYIIYMTYDLHGQWDSGNQWSQEGCSTGTCLRTDVNLTETIGTLILITKAGVPSNKVVVGVTSYGRSFAMAEAGCYGPQCTFLGSAGNSQAEPGPCTQTAGYIANAEIQAIIANSTRVNQNFLDPDSNTNILVYDNTQWVGWMSEDTKAARTTLYKALSMGGTSDWATDLQEYNSPAYAATSWGAVLTQIRMGVDPYEEGTRTGNWTTAQCDDPAFQNQDHMTCSQRWSELDASNAWSDAINIWNTIDKQHFQASESAFTESIFNTFHGPEMGDCGITAPGGSCSASLTCASFQGFGVGNGGSGPAAMLIYESFININAMYSQFLSAIQGAAGYIDAQLSAFETTFAPVPPPKSDEWLLILISVLGLGLTAIAAPFFDGALVGLGEEGTQVAKDITYATLSFGASIATAAIPAPGSPGTWTAASQADFSATLGSVILGWESVTKNTLFNLFNGSEPSITLLTTMIDNGNLIECDGGSAYVDTQAGQGAITSVENTIAEALFGFAIPAVWELSGTAAFVIDSGYPCSAQNPLTQYMSAATQEATFSCFNNNLYYLVYPKGSWSGCSLNDPSQCTYFDPPPGLDSLGGPNWGGITRDDLIRGSVNTYIANGNANGGPIANPMDQQTLKDLQNQDITTAGYIRLPVCSPQVAWASWSNPGQSNSSAQYYPCNPLQGTTKCSGYTYQDQTTSASPLVSDCQTIVKNIQGTAGKWTTGIGPQRTLASFGSCHFGVQNSGISGDVTYFTGTQDIVNIINAAISLYSWNGLVGAKGNMQCGGDAGGQNVVWGLY